MLWDFCCGQMPSEAEDFVPTEENKKFARIRTSMRH